MDKHHRSEKRTYQKHQSEKHSRKSDQDRDQDYQSLLSEKMREFISTIVLKVYKYCNKDNKQNPVELEAQRGVPACKMLVDQDFPINSEYESLVSKDNKNKFKEYVAGKFVGRWWINE